VIVIAGAFAMVLSVGTNLAGGTLWNYWFGLVLLGIGWNFMFIGGTMLLTEVHRPEERARVQALNDFLVMSVVTFSSFASGAIHHALGWTAVNLGIVVPVLVAFAAAVWLVLLRRRKRQAVT
jgi:MFS family permease